MSSLHSTMSDAFDISIEEEADLLVATEASERYERVQTNNNDTSISHKTPRLGLPPSAQLANRVLKERFGLDRFRSKQEAAITRLLDGESATIVFPTGAGKSLCYQVPAVAFKIQDAIIGNRIPQESGITVVVSPLIALMKDQVDALRRRNIMAAVLNSSISRDQYTTTEKQICRGELDLLYCAPERLRNEKFVTLLKNVPGGIRLLAVDEAHCISEWGHSFRPDYLKIARFASEARVERVACLTATATPTVARDICDAFSIPPEGLFTTAVYRPNLRLLAQTRIKESDNLRRLIKFLRQYPGSAVIYVITQAATEKLAEELRERKFQASAYHAGMDQELRTKTQDEFLASDRMIVVATIAFGMGIDKPDIRNVVHHEMPGSIEAYSQQVGRAGRDGLPSVCSFTLSNSDLYLQDVFTYSARPSVRSLTLLLRDICAPARSNLRAGDTFAVSMEQQSRNFDINVTPLDIVYAQLELRFELFRAAGTLRPEYKYIVKDQLAIRDGSSEAQSIIEASVKIDRWSYVALDDLARSAKLSYFGLVDKLDDWHNRGFIHLVKSGTRHVFRLERPLPCSQDELTEIVQQLDASMEVKEKQDFERTRALVDLISGTQCFSRALAAYFGDALEEMPEECGHCNWCETHQQVLLRFDTKQSPDPDRLQSFLTRVTARDDPRYLANIAFGIKTPRILAEGLEELERTGLFGRMKRCDFEELLEIFTEECNQNRVDRVKE